MSMNASKAKLARIRAQQLHSSSQLTEDVAHDARDGLPGGVDHVELFSLCCNAGSSDNGGLLQESPARKHECLAAGVN